MPQTNTFLSVHPVLPVQDVLRSIKFYDRLGFTTVLAYPDDEPGYAVVKKDTVAIHLQLHAAEEWERVERPMLRFKVSDAQTLLDEYRRTGAFHEQTDVRFTDWGTLEFAFFDPDMNGLTFFQEQ